MRTLRTIFVIFTIFCIPQAYALPANEKFITIADIHFDPFLACKTKPCPLIKQLQQAPTTLWDDILAKANTPPIRYGTDTNYTLLKSSLAAAKREASTTHVQFGLVLGDFLAHNFDGKYARYTQDTTKEGYTAFVKKTVEFLTNEIKKSFPHTDIYITIGNNDSYQEDYTTDPSGLFFKDMGRIATNLVTNPESKKQILATFYQDGYYAVNAPHQPKLRIIVLNSVLFSTHAKSNNDQEAQKELEWLHNELSLAEKNHQRVLITMHIPIGVDVYSSLLNPFKLVDFWKPEYSDRFLFEIKQSSAIVGIFTGHIHADAFQIITNNLGLSIPFSSTPSISPIFGNNPGFKIYSYATSTLHLVDFNTYYYALNAKNTWGKEYSFGQVYYLKHGHNELTNGMNQLIFTGKLAERYKKYYSVSHNNQPITEYNVWIPYYWCNIRGVTQAEYRKCLAHATAFSSDTIF